MVATDAGFSVASLALILVVIAESFTNVAGLLRSVSESIANATGASEAPSTKHAVASLSFTVPPVVIRASAILPVRPPGTYQTDRYSGVGGVLHRRWCGAASGACGLTGDQPNPNASCAFRSASSGGVRNGAFGC